MMINHIFCNWFHVGSLLCFNNLFRERLFFCFQICLCFTDFIDRSETVGLLDSWSLLIRCHSPATSYHRIDVEVHPSWAYHLASSVMCNRHEADLKQRRWRQHGGQIRTFPVGITSKIPTSWSFHFIGTIQELKLATMCPRVHRRVTGAKWGRYQIHFHRQDWRNSLNLHSWEARVIPALNNFIRHKAKVLSEDVPKSPSSRLQSEFQPDLWPIYLVLQFQNQQGFPSMIWNHEVVDPERCHRSWSFHQAINPPLVAIFVHCFLVIDWLPGSYRCENLHLAGILQMHVAFPFSSVLKRWGLAHMSLESSATDGADIPTPPNGGCWHSFLAPTIVGRRRVELHDGSSQFISQFFTVFSQSFGPSRARIAASGHLSKLSNQPYSHVFCEELQPIVVVCSILNKILGILLITLSKKFATAFQVVIWFFASWKPCVQSNFE